MLKHHLEKRQISIYLLAVVLAVATAGFLPDTTCLESWINPALALMLFVTFLQLPFPAFRDTLTNFRFFAALLCANFVVIPVFVALLLSFVSAEPIPVLGMLLVLLAPCIDYVVTFSRIGKSDSRGLLAATPVLLVMQMLLLPVYLRFFIGGTAGALIRADPFVKAFAWLIMLPLLLAVAVRLWAARQKAGHYFSDFLGYFPVPATALVLFIVMASVIPRINLAGDSILQVLPVYIIYAAVAPLAGWIVSRIFRLDVFASRSVAFSTGTRNSLVVLPLAMAVPDAVPVLPAVIVTQTLVELASELIYIRLIPWLIREKPGGMKPPVSG